MTHHHLRNPQTIKEITASFEVGTMSIEDLALHYGVSSFSIRKILAEAGLVTLSSHKTKREAAMLDYLQMYGITDIDKLKARLLTVNNAKAFYMKQSVQTRVGWLNESIQEEKSLYENNDPVQHTEFHSGSPTRN